MEILLEEIIGLLITVGPWIVFAVAMLETAVFVGLLVPAEAMVLLGAFMAEQGYFEVEHILAAAVFGGLAGDHAGYGLGRFGGTRLVSRDGRAGRLWDRYEVRTADLFRRHAALAVTLARFISFVRTLMPWCAGIGRMPYVRFAVYDLLGVLGWAVASVALGYAAGESWRLVAGGLGTLGGAVVAIGVLGVALVVYRRRWAARS